MIMEVERKYLVLPFHFHYHFLYPLPLPLYHPPQQWRIQGEGVKGNPTMPPPLVSFDMGQTRFDPLLYITKMPFLPMVVPQNARKHAILKCKIQKFSGEGVVPLPSPHPQWGGVCFTPFAPSALTLPPPFFNVLDSPVLLLLLGPICNIHCTH